MGDPIELRPGECRICDAAAGDTISDLSEQELEIHASEHQRSTANVLPGGLIIRLKVGNRWTEREPYGPAARLMEERLNEEFKDTLGDARFRFNDEPVGRIHPDTPRASDCPVCQEELAAAMAALGDEDDDVDEEPTITDEAYGLVMGPRQSSYSHPAQDFRATGRQWAALLENWLLAEGYAIVRDVGETDEDGEAIVEEWEDAGFPDIKPRVVALMMAALKASRESQKPKRDNRVDGIGYWLCADRIEGDY